MKRVVFSFLIVIAGCDAKPDPAAAPGPAFAVNLPAGPEAPLLPERSVGVTVRAGGRIEIAGGNCSYEVGDRAALRSDLAERVKGIAYEERSLILAADVSTRFGTIAVLIDAGWGAGIGRWYLEVAPGGDGRARAFPARLQVGCVGKFPGLEVDENGELTVPCDIDGAPEEARVLLSWDSKAAQLQRLFGQNFMPAGPEGDEKLERVLRNHGKQFDRRGAARPPVVLDCGPRVPWQHVVDVANVARRAGWPLVEFPRGGVFDESRPSTPESR